MYWIQCLYSTNYFYAVICPRAGARAGRGGGLILDSTACPVGTVCLTDVISRELMLTV